MDLGDQNVFPDAMQARGHEVVHDVVAIRDLVEYVVDETLLLVDGHAAFAEMGFLGFGGHAVLQIGVIL